jgi:hypothetical protein
MSKRVVSMPRAPGSLDLVSHGRRGPGLSGGLTPAQVEQVARTVRKTPEVVVKVSGGARDASGAKAHFDYIDRHGRLGLETDDGHSLVGKDAGEALVADWNLELSAGQYRPKPADGEKDQRPKVVHNIVLSMPGRTPPEAVLQAARKFARENFALQYRYAMVLHTDQAHPHVHLVVKAEHEYEPGQRLTIRKATLRQWREDFAACLRELGVAANATPATLRGQAPKSKKDAIQQRLKAMADYDSLPAAEKAKRKPPLESTFMRAKVETVARELQRGSLVAEPGKVTLLQTRRAVEAEWVATAAVLREQGEAALAHEVEAFARSMPKPRTEKERIASGLLAQIDAQRRYEAAPEPRERPTRRPE